MPRDTVGRRSGVLRQCRTCESEHTPVVELHRAEAAVKAFGGFVPVEHRPFQAAAAPGVGDLGEMEQQSLAGAVSAEFGFHEQVFQIKAGSGEEGGIIEKIKREAGGAAPPPPPDEHAPPAAPPPPAPLSFFPLLPSPPPPPPPSR